MSAKQRDYVRAKAILLAVILEPPLHYTRTAAGTVYGHTLTHLVEAAFMDFENARAEFSS